MSVEKNDKISQPNHIQREDDDYPCRLRELSLMPQELYVRGKLPDPDRPAVAIVGARRCSPYGRIQAFRFARELSRHGVQVISGLALGIDTESHLGALEGNTPTYAVLGSGTDVCYPRSNRPLLERIIREGGGIISEFPPGTPPTAWHFPIRNRIISGLADLVLVVEASSKSGSLITAQYAIEQGKTVYAVPGPIHSSGSEGTNQLIFDGAAPALDPADILLELGINTEKKPDQITPEANNDESETARMILNCFSFDAESDESIRKKTGLPLPIIHQELIRLCLSGQIRELGRNLYLPK